MSDGTERGGPTDGATQLVTRSRARPKKPTMYQVVLLNDDYTPMEFVVWLLVKVFRKDQHTATRLMLEVHTKGKGVAGVYPYDVAQTKIVETQTLAEEQGHPLQAVLEPVETDA